MIRPGCTVKVIYQTEAAPMSNVAVMSGLPLILTTFLVTLGACRSMDIVDSKGRRPVAFEIIPVTAEEQEEAARQLAPCPEVRADTADWREWELPEVGVILRLPEAYVRVEDESPPSQVLWQGPDTTLIFLTSHSGDGRASTVLQPEGEFEGSASDEVCSLEVTGRTAMLFRSRFRVAGRTYYFAKVDLGVRPGFGIGAAVLSHTPERRDAFIAALSTARSHPEAPGGG